MKFGYFLKKINGTMDAGMEKLSTIDVVCFKARNAQLLLFFQVTRSRYLLEFNITDWRGLCGTREINYELSLSAKKMSQVVKQVLVRYSRRIKGTKRA